MKYLKKSQIKNKLYQEFSYPNDMDEEMVELCNVINSIPGLRTMYTCSGHGYEGWYLVIYATSDMAFEVIVKTFEESHLKPTTFKYDPINLRYTPTTFYTPIPEREIAIYCHEFDQHTKKERIVEYKRIVNHLLEYVPRKHWYGNRGK